jgi:hypothetical protein
MKETIIDRHAPAATTVIREDIISSAHSTTSTTVLNESPKHKSLKKKIKGIFHHDKK